MKVEQVQKMERLAIRMLYGVAILILISISLMYKFSYLINQ